MELEIMGSNTYIWKWVEEFSFEWIHAPSKPIKLPFQIGLVSKKYDIQKVSGPRVELYIGNLNGMCGGHNEIKLPIYEKIIEREKILIIYLLIYLVTH